ncbi:MAG: hypothetical protein HY569_00290, partial [Candidatus Magasanikbacteria bacterium]|nr:hypothetical protein [Candidatus Magasanikbacteria bacterium]
PAFGGKRATAELEGTAAHSVQERAVPPQAERASDCAELVHMQNH